MTDLPQEKKGMSKGCVIALIVVGAIVILAIAIGVVCYAKKDEMARYSVRMVVSGFKTKIADNPIEGIDTVGVNAIADSFVILLDSTELRLEAFGKFFQRIQSIDRDKVVDSTEVVLMMDAMIEYFPELDGIRPQNKPAIQDTIIKDSL